MATNNAIEFLVWMLIAASVIAVLAARIRIPYTVALVLGGLALGTIHLPALDELIRQMPAWMTPNATLILFLPPLLFEGSLKLQFRHLRENLAPILLLANLGVLAATLITGFAVHWLAGLPMLTALVFGAIVSATDPISVLAIFRDMAVSKRLSVIVEGESLLNDGTAAVIFGILVAGTTSGELSLGTGIQEFFVVVLGGAAMGLALGYTMSKVTERIDDPQIEITLTTILAYGSYLAAESLHLSGVIATVAAGLMVGNFGARVGMSPRTRIALWSFWEYASFVINSVVFLLIGLEVRVVDLTGAWQAMLLAIGAAVLARMTAVYVFSAVSNRFTFEKIPLRWQHVMVWGGLRGALSLALALSLGADFPHRGQILVMTFGVVAFTIIGQGLTIKPLLLLLRIVTRRDDEPARAKVERMAVSSGLAELEDMVSSHVISRPAYEALRQEFISRLEGIDRRIAEIHARDESLTRQEIRAARSRLIAAEKSAIEQALHDGLITPSTATTMINAADTELDKLLQRGAEAATSFPSETGRTL